MNPTTMNPTTMNPGDDPMIGWSGTAGVVAVVVLSLNILMGLLLSTRYNPVRSWPHRRIPLFDLHNWTGYLAIAVVLLHPALLLFQDVVKFSVVDVLLPVDSPRQPVVNTIGAVAAYAILFVVVTSALRRAIGIRRWKVVHYASYLALPAFLVHGVFTNPNLDGQAADLTDGVKFIVYACTVAVVGAIVWRVVHGVRRTALREAAATGTASAIDYPATWAGQLQVARIFQETPSVKTFRMVAPDRRRLPFTFKPGQFMTLTLPVAGQDVRRTYTIASPPTRTSYVEITVKREGVASQYLHDTLAAGDLVDIRALSGGFTFTGTESEGVVLIAGGVGVTPMMSVLRSLTDAAWDHGIWMVFAVRTPMDVIYQTELAYLQQRHPNFHLRVVVEDVLDTTWHGDVGRVTAALLADAIPELPRRRVYLCGPAPMMDTVRTLLRELGVADGQILTEAFSTPVDQIERDEAAALSQGACAATVRFQRSNRSTSVEPMQTLLDAAAAAGIALDHSCRNGTCGTCRVKLVSGTVAMGRSDALLAADVADRLVLACQARPTSTEVLLDA